MMAAPAAFAQNAFSNVKAANVYDGISMAQLEEIFSNLILNDSEVTVIRRTTSSGVPYLVLASPALGLEVNVGGINGTYGGSDAELFEGILFITGFDADQFSGFDSDEINRERFYVKFIQTPGVGMIRSEMVAAGGVTVYAILNAFAVHTIGVDNILSSSVGTTVSYKSGEHKTVLKSYGGDRETFSIAIKPGSSKIQTIDENDFVQERLIESVIDAVAK